jgi:hypothetical protein
VEGTVLSKKRTVPFLEPEYCYTHGRWDVRNSQNLFAFVAIELLTISHLHNKRDSCLFFPAVIFNLAPVIFNNAKKPKNYVEFWTKKSTKNTFPFSLLPETSRKKESIYKIGKVDHVSFIKKYCIALDCNQYSFHQE